MCLCLIILCFYQLWVMTQALPNIFLDTKMALVHTVMFTLLFLVTVTEISNKQWVFYLQLCVIELVQCFMGFMIWKLTKPLLDDQRISILREDRSTIRDLLNSREREPSLQITSEDNSLESEF